jgi:MtfA peptidase
MVLSLLQRWFGKPVPPHIEDALWERVTGQFAFISRMEAAVQAKLRLLSAQFIAGKQWHGAAGFALTDEVIVAIAVQACLPVLNLSLDLYGGFVGIVIYPVGFMVPSSDMDEDGVVHESIEAAAGQAMAGGPVVLSWEDAQSPDEAAGFNVVIHEFAHKLDMADGLDDGIPIFDARFHASMNRASFEATMQTAYQRFCDAVDALPDEWDEPALWGLDPYAAEHPAEFFAVSVEAYLLHGLELPVWREWRKQLAAYLRSPTPPP